MITGLANPKEPNVFNQIIQLSDSLKVINQNY
jgi:hypothetical protein